jgi:hypothetical protein
MPTIGLMPGNAEASPSLSASPCASTEPTVRTTQYPAPLGVAAIEETTFDTTAEFASAVEPEHDELNTTAPASTAPHLPHRDMASS